MGAPIAAVGPDFSVGVSIDDIPDGGMLRGQAGGEALILVRRGEQVSALAAACGHYGAPLFDGVVVDNEVRCPWHHACFDIRSGEAVGPPSPRHVDAWEVQRDGRRVKLGAKKVRASATMRPTKGAMVVIGAGAAGDAAADMLRREGYGGDVVVVARDVEPLPIDRPNLSKDYLAGTLPEDWLPVRGGEHYQTNAITLRPGVAAARIDTQAKQVRLANGDALIYDKLLLATGASPVRLSIPGADKPHAFVLRNLADAQRIVARMQGAKVAAVIGASFIGLEVAAALRMRGLEVHVIAPDARPLERVLGPELGDFVRGLHEKHGVVFHLGRKPASIGESDVVLDDGSKVRADMVVMGVGVRPETALAEAAGLKVDRGIIVDRFLQTSAPDVFAAGDVARYPAGSETWRVEHWVAAQRQGQTAARNMLGKQQPFTTVPFFWSQHYDVPINYVGHAESWDKIEMSGNLTDPGAILAYWKGGSIRAVASVYRDRESLLASEALTNNDQASLVQLLRS